MPMSNELAPRRTACPPAGLREDLLPAAALAGATVIVELGVYAAGRLAGAGTLGACLASLLACAVWVALAAPAASAGARRTLGAILRGGIVADASLVSLLALWLLARDEQGRPYVTPLATIEIYCTLAAMALAGVAAVRCARRPAGRLALAATATIVLLAALATPLWTSGLLEAAGPAAGQVAAWAVRANPFYSIASAVAPRTHFVWHLAPWMYQLTNLGDYAAVPPSAWYDAVWRYALAAGALGLASLLRSKRAIRAFPSACEG